VRAATPIAVIVGSGMADFAANAGSVDVTTRFGKPSAALRQAEIAGRQVYVLPRHGDRHDIPPHAINYRANLQAVYLRGARTVISVNTVGVIPSSPGPGELAVPAQLIDYTWGREHTFFDGQAGVVDHVDVTEPFTPALRLGLLAAAEAAGVACFDGGVYGVTQGPRLETAAEVDRYEREGVDFLGMTAMPEVALARELGLDVACLSLVVNAAAGRGRGPIHADIEASMSRARGRATRVLEHFVANWSL
jgi:5'-methylthioinosine phosphorylase